MSKKRISRKPSQDWPGTGPGIITIDLTKRLPDISRRQQLSSGFEDYGRFAILANGDRWHGPLESSHPQNTRDGFYWAKKGDTLLLSPRGSTFGWPDIMTDDVIRWLLSCLRMNRVYRQFRVVRSSLSHDFAHLGNRDRN